MAVSAVNARDIYKGKKEEVISHKNYRPFVAPCVRVPTIPLVRQPGNEHPASSHPQPSTEHPTHETYDSIIFRLLSRHVFYQVSIYLGIYFL